tara:strand:- start:1881 stop:2423 length:543 start_codon:yes stop_codon:yes gene_type:complete
MINLIPPHARKQVKIEYWVRVSSVWVLMVALGLCVVLVLMVPSYILIRSQLNTYQEQYSQALADSVSYQELEDAVVTANRYAQKLLSYKSPVSFTGIIDELKLVTDDTIELSYVDIKRTESGEVETMVVKGEAQTRIDLVAYRDAIEAHPFFTSADLPISNLAKDKEVPFSITVAIKQPE